jgi:predicted XRE-type DNA-binding protein
MLKGVQEGDMTTTKRSRVTASSGNVFADLGLPDAEEALAKAEIAARICDIIAERKLSQVRAAALLGIDQPKVSALMRGRLEGFSSDRLFRFLTALDRDVEIVIRPKKKDAKHGRVHVMVA